MARRQGGAATRAAAPTRAADAGRGVRAPSRPRWSRLPIRVRRPSPRARTCPPPTRPSGRSLSGGTTVASPGALDRHCVGTGASVSPPGRAPAGPVRPAASQNLQDCRGWVKPAAPAEALTAPPRPWWAAEAGSAVRRGTGVSAAADPRVTPGVRRRWGAGPGPPPGGGWRRTLGTARASRAVPTGPGGDGPDREARRPAALLTPIACGKPLYRGRVRKPSARRRVAAGARPTRCDAAGRVGPAGEP